MATLGLGLLLAGTTGFWLFRRAPVPPLPQVNTHINDVVLNEAANQLDAHPEHALKLAQEIIDATPDAVSVDPDAYALKIAALYKMNLLELLEAAANEARDRKVSGQEMLKNSKLLAMLDHEKTRRKLSPELRERLLKGL